MYNNDKGLEILKGLPDEKKEAVFNIIREIILTECKYWLGMIEMEGVSEDEVPAESYEQIKNLFNEARGNCYFCSFEDREYVSGTYICPSCRLKIKKLVEVEKKVRGSKNEIYTNGHPKQGSA